MSDNTPDPLQVTQKFLASKNINGRILFAMIAGSHAYNLNIDNSDYDFFAVYAAKTTDVLSLPERRPPQVIVNSKNEKPDIQVYEVGKFCEALQTGNPMLVQSLFVERNCYQSDLWKRLKKNALKFITAQTIVA